MTPLLCLGIGLFVLGFAIWSWAMFVGGRVWERREALRRILKEVRRDQH